MKAVLCPVCCGSGKVMPPTNSYSTAIAQPITCHGCGGVGWVQIGDDATTDYKQSFIRAVKENVCIDH